MRDPFGAAVSSLKIRLRQGSYGFGRPLLITEVATELGLSTTPVREAMARLVGEELLEEHRGRGYMTLRLDASDLAELYDLERVYLAYAAEVARQSGPAFPDAPPSLESAPGNLPERLEAGLARLARLSGQGALARAYARTAERLGPARRCEPLVLAELEGECLALEEALDNGAFEAVDVWVAAFSERRLASVIEIASTLRRGPISLGKI